MTISTLENDDVVAEPAWSSAQLDPLRQLPRQMLQQVAAARTKRELLDGLAIILNRCVPSVAILYFPRNERGELAESLPLYLRDADGQVERFSRQLLAACQMACRQGEVDVRLQAAPSRLIIAAPVALRGGDPEASGCIFPDGESPQQLLLLVQMIVSHIVLWQVLSSNQDGGQDALDSAALVELLDRLAAAPDLRHACYDLAGQLQQHLQCRRVAVGLRPVGAGRSRLTAISGVAQFDKHSPMAQSLEAAMDEAILRDEVTIWPPSDDSRCAAALAHSKLCSLENATSVLTTPLRDREGLAIGALALLDVSPESAAHAMRFLQAAEQSLGTSVSVAARLEGGRLARAVSAIGRFARSARGKIAAAVVGLVAITLAIPFPYRLGCECRIEPVTRRFIAAPFEGTLERALVKPGDIVREGDLLARMDGREIRWKRAGVLADRNQAQKKRDAAQASHNYSEMQIAALEMERADLELQLLDHRASHLEIRSSVAGIVASGDLERAEGAPLSVGQTLFEIAPLEKMIVEVAVADDDVAYFRAGQPISVRLEAYPGDTWQTQSVKLHPRSEIRDEANVFIAEAELENADGRLRPGMKGRAKIETNLRPIGWILFHKPWEFVAKKLYW